jgi:hypothetical protein
METGGMRDRPYSNAGPTLFSSWGSGFRRGLLFGDCFLRGGCLLDRLFGIGGGGGGGHGGFPRHGAFGGFTHTCGLLETFFVLFAALTLDACAELLAHKMIGGGWLVKGSRKKGGSMEELERGATSK